MLESIWDLLIGGPARVVAFFTLFISFCMIVFYFGPGKKLVDVFGAVILIASSLVEICSLIFGDFSYAKAVELLAESPRRGLLTSAVLALCVCMSVALHYGLKDGMDAPGIGRRIFRWIGVLSALLYTVFCFGGISLILLCRQ